MNDEPTQAEAAQRAMAAEPAFIVKAVMVELGHADAFLTFDGDLRRQAARLGVKPPVVAP